MTNAEIDFLAIRQGLAELPRANNHAPGAHVEPESIVAVMDHRNALDPDRSLVVGNRGMGKSFWAHALADPVARQHAARFSKQLTSVDARIGFNASDRADPIAPTPAAIGEAIKAGKDPDDIWRAVLLRVAHARGVPMPTGVEMSRPLAHLVTWVQANSHLVDQTLTALDDEARDADTKVVVIFDALDRLASDWTTTRRLVSALLKRALAASSYRRLRLKLFMRRDQFDDSTLFEFPDGSKIRNTRVDLTWSPSDLYTLLFDRLARHPDSAKAFASLCADVAGKQSNDTNRLLVNAMAGEFMGTNAKSGRVYTWLPLHLSDARQETSPRTFLTAWRGAALHPSPPPDRAVGHLGLLEGVRQASEDRLQELLEDYRWIKTALDPLHGQMVPMERNVLEQLWKSAGTAEAIRRDASGRGLPPVQLEDTTRSAEASLVDALSSIGVLEIRSNGKINVPDIFRVDAGIKRKGGVKPPVRATAQRS